MKRLNMLSLSFILAFTLAACSHPKNVEPTIAPVQVAQDQEHENIDEAVSIAIKSQSGFYAFGETATEGHIIVGTEQHEKEIMKVYVIGSYGAFGFENGVFTKISGSGAIPTVMTFAQDQNGEYTLLEYQEPMDGSLYIESIKEMFPPHLHARVLAAHDDYPALAKQQETQAREYLKSVGRTAEVSADYVEKQLADIDVEASNRLFAEVTKVHPFPYWLGTTERVENGARYVYETSQSKTDDGYDLIIFQKRDENGTVVEQYRHKIVGSEPQLVD